MQPAWFDFQPELMLFLQIQGSEHARDRGKSSQASLRWVKVAQEHWQVRKEVQQEQPIAAKDSQ